MFLIRFDIAKNVAIISNGCRMYMDTIPKDYTYKY